MCIPFNIPVMIVLSPTVAPCSGTGNQKGRGNGRAGWMNYAGKSSLWEATPRQALRPTPTQYGS